MKKKKTEDKPVVKKAPKKVKEEVCVDDCEPEKVELYYVYNSRMGLHTACKTKEEASKVAEEIKGTYRAV